MYLTIEGIDTSGKSTQIQALNKIFPNAVFTKEPGGTKLGVKLREIVLFNKIDSSLAELFIFLADRAEHIKQIIEPNLDKLIISDRGIISGIAYARVTNDISLEKLVELNSFAVNNIFSDKIIILKLNKQELTKRLFEKEQDKIEERGIDYLLQVQNGLIEASKYLKLNTLIIDASLHVEIITKQILNFIGEDN